MKSRSPLESILSDIQKALEARLYYLAIAVSLSLPDVCVCLACEPGKAWTNQKKYEDWCATNLIPGFQHLTAADVYRIRCGVLHQAKFGRPDDRFDRILFTVPESGWTVHDVLVSAAKAAPGSDSKAFELAYKSLAFLSGGIEVRPGEKALILAAVIFCKQMIDATSKWFEKNAEDPNVKANSPHLVRTRPQFPPYFVGIQVIA